MQFNFSQNYFELFELDAEFSIDSHHLMKSYQQLQSEFHPDRFADQDEQTKRLAMQATTFINQAYKTLREEPSRARYLLVLQGVEFNGEKDTTQDMDFLSAQMSLREQIDEAHKQAEPLQCLDELAGQARQQKVELIENYQRYFDSKDWPQAKEVVLKLQFFTRLQQQIDHQQERLEDQLL